MESVRFLVRRDDLSRTHVAPHTVAAPESGQIVVQVQRFALTANNITYGVTGDTIGYWQFFPAGQGWGIIPVWGFAEVVESAHDDIAVGERLYGFLPMASHVTLTPVKVSAARFVDGAGHRSELPAVYNHYVRTAGEPHYDRALDDERMLLFPLFVTSYCLADFLSDNACFGATQVIVPSASSKTAIGFADALIAGNAPMHRVGLTSAGHLDQVKALNRFDEVLTYDQLELVDNARPTVIVDMSGHGQVLSSLHARLGDNMRMTSKVGLTHHGAQAGGEGLINDRSRFFFAPSHIAKRHQDWGPGEFEKRAYAFWRQAAARSRDWLRIEPQIGVSALQAVYGQLLRGEISPETGIVAEF